MFRTFLRISQKNNQCITRYSNFRNIPKNLQRKTQKDILQHYLGLSYPKSAALLRNNDILQSIDNKIFEDTVRCLKKMGLDTNDIYNNPATLALHCNTVEHNFKYLQEAGFTHISAQILLKFRTVVKKPVILLKAHGVIPEDTNVPKRLYSYLFPRPDEFPVLEQFSEEDNIVHIHEIIFHHYLVWRLQSTQEEINRIFRIYDKFKYKSFDLISRMIQVLTEELNFTNQKLLQNSYLFQNGPNFIRQIMTNFPTLAGVDITNVLYRFPKIAAVHPENIATIDKHLKAFGISDVAISKCLDIYTLAPNTVLHRLNEVLTIPEFEVLLNSNRMVRLLLSQNKAKLRLEYLQKSKVRCASVNILCSSDKVFEKYAQEGNDRTKGSDIINYIMERLYVSETFVRKNLSHNPHWCHVPLTLIQNTLYFLLENSFPKSEIANMPVILIYPKNPIRDALLEIENNEETSKMKLSARERLNLCLYFIERKHHFSGDGVWNNATSETVATSN